MYSVMRIKTVRLFNVFKHMKSVKGDLSILIKMFLSNGPQKLGCHIQTSCRGPGFESHPGSLAACHHPDSCHLPTCSAKRSETFLPPLTCLTVLSEFFFLSFIYSS